ncbi:radical SAM family RiPP maturation amino acid epimerase [Paraburkholderia sp. Clong3]|uniref:radical SAM family RiPP maturation amino acid epimerase n=1 Tax=Paraburkholderia sp. Clong3 TaxID=2991061 RepID=UPI003D1E05A7
MADMRKEREERAWEIARSFGEDVVPLFTVPGCADSEYVSAVARTKRLLERWSMDNVFRARLYEHPQEACDAYGIDIDPQNVRILWHEQEARQRKQDRANGLPAPEDSRSVRRYRSFIAEKLAFRDWMRDVKAGVSGRFGLWRLQQMHRCTLELGPAKSAGLVHATVAFELQKGCSVGCWFCGVGAEKLSAHFAYSPEHAALWRDTLDVCRDVIGDSVFNGFCYWASDPLDNPDYIHFITDFRRALGRYPQTTTAIPLRNEAKTREILDMVRDCAGEIQRFSILTLKMLDDVHSRFTPEELINVELLPLNRESGVPKANAGRARVKSPRGHAKTSDEQPQTIACMSGFLFNMVDRSVRMVTPCHASDRWPNGYRVLAQGHFDNAEQLRKLLIRLIDGAGHVVTHDTTVALNPCLVATTVTREGYDIASIWVKRTLVNFPAFAALDRLLRDGVHTAADVATRIEDETGTPLADTFNILNELLRLGALDTEPAEAEPVVQRVGAVKAMDSA